MLIEIFFVALEPENLFCYEPRHECHSFNLETINKSNKYNWGEIYNDNDLYLIFEHHTSVF